MAAVRVLVCGYVCSVLLQKRVVVRVKIPCVRTRARACVCVSGCVYGVHFQKHVVFRVKMPCVRVVCVFVGMYVRRSPPKTLTNTHHLHVRRSNDHNVPTLVLALTVTHDIITIGGNCRLRQLLMVPVCVCVWGGVGVGVGVGVCVCVLERDGNKDGEFANVSVSFVCIVCACTAERERGVGGG